MGIKSLIKLYFRAILFITYSFVVIYDYSMKQSIASTIVNFKLFNIISFLHIFWAYLIIEMLLIIIPKFNKHSYNGKHLIKHYEPETNYNHDKLQSYTKQNIKRALISAVFWILLNTPIIILYSLAYIDRTILYWLFFFYYFADTICINVFCIFHFALIKSKCCNECRIYNWSYFMYATPLLLMPSFWNYSIAFLAIIILIWWEVSVYLYPERFSEISNKTLQCQHCLHTCRYKKKNKIEHLIELTLKKLGLMS